MSYVIYYGKKSAAETDQKKPDLFGITKGVLLVSLILIASMLVFGRQSVMDFFIPGDPAVTKVAWHTMVSELEQGEGFSEAVTAFCQTLIEHEKIS